MRFQIHSMLLVLSIVAAGSAQDKKKAPPPRLTDAEIKTADFVYRKTPQGELTMHVYYPEGWKKSDMRPVIVFFFGGGWKGGTHTQFMPQAQYFASRGMVACCADYRILNIHKTTPDQCVVDAKAAIRWVRRHAQELGIDPHKVVSSGGSAGGHLAAATALVPGFDADGDDAKVSPVPNALLLFNPALNLKGRPTLDAQGKDVSEAISPTLYLHKETPPAAIFFGTADKLIDHGIEYAAKAKVLGVRADLHRADDQPHGFFNRSPWLEVTTAKADEFLQSLGYLQGPATIKSPVGAKSLN
jgi:acetyl esterase/lipase